MRSGPFMAMGVSLLFFASQAGRGRRLFLLTTRALCRCCCFLLREGSVPESLRCPLLRVRLLHPRKIAFAIKGLSLAVLGVAIAGTWLRYLGVLA